jgi:small subunit ribosomal protein S16
MLVIRLLRIGRKNQPSYKIVVTDKRRAPKGGRFAAEVGSWNPFTKQRILKKEEIKTWLSKGAKPSDTVYNMLVEEKVIEGKKISVHKKSKKEQPKEEAKPEAPKETPKEEPKPELEPKEVDKIA